MHGFEQAVIVVHAHQDGRTLVPACDCDGGMIINDAVDHLLQVRTGLRDGDGICNLRHGGDIYAIAYK